MEAQQRTGAKTHRGPRPHKGIGEKAKGMAVMGVGGRWGWRWGMQFASIFLSLLLPLMSIKGCWMSNSKRRKLPLSKISSFAERKEAGPPLSLTIQTHDSFFLFFFYQMISSLKHKRNMDKQPPRAFFFFFFLSFPNGLGAPEQLRPLCLFSQSKISLSSCLNPAETLHPDSNTSLQLLHSIIPCLPPFSPLL